MPVNAVRMSAGVSADKGMRSRLTDLYQNIVISKSQWVEHSKGTSGRLGTRTTFPCDSRGAAEEELEAEAVITGAQVRKLVTMCSAGRLHCPGSPMRPTPYYLL
jgi:hypothetical protein